MWRLRAPLAPVHSKNPDAAVQVVPGAPYQIRADDLTAKPIKMAVPRKGRPCRVADEKTLPLFTDTSRGRAQ